MKITLLGGAGIIGRVIARDLAENERVDHIVLADLNLPGAQSAAETIASPKVSLRQADVTHLASLTELLSGSDCVINAVQHYYNLSAMEAALAASTHYVDLGGLFHTTRRQLALHQRFQAAGLTAVIGIGSCPGIANVQAAALADRLESIESLHIYNAATKDGSGDRLNWAYSINTILDEISLPPVVFTDGMFQEVEPLSGEEMFLFREPIGWEKTHLSLHSEVATLPVTFGEKGLKSCFFKISFFGYTEAALRRLHFLTELGLAGTEGVILRDGNRVVPRDLLLTLLDRYVQNNPAPADPHNPGFKDIATVARGTVAGQPVSLRMDTTAYRHPDWQIGGGTVLVAAPPAIVAVWLAAGEIPVTGVLPPEVAVDHRRFFVELARRGGHTELTVTDQVA